MKPSKLHAQALPRLWKSGCATSGRAAAKMDRMKVLAPTADAA